MNLLPRVRRLEELYRVGDDLERWLDSLSDGELAALIEETTRLIDSDDAAKRLDGAKATP